MRSRSDECDLTASGPEAGLAVAPASAHLRLARADALERQGEVYAEREELRNAAAVTADPALLRRNAEMQDEFGSSAAEAYSRLAAALEKSAPRSAEHVSAIERGLEVSLRDGDAQARIVRSGPAAASGGWPVSPRPCPS